MAVDIKNSHSLSDYGQYNNKVDITMHKLHLKDKLTMTSNNTALIINTTSLPNKYWDYLMKRCIEYTFSDKDYLRYKYQPKLFCYEFYGNLELWSFLLKVNHMTSILDFNKKTIKVFDDGIIKLLEEILIIEDPDIRRNSIYIE